MITEFLNSLEDPKQRLLGPNIWTMKWIGLILPENKLYKVVYLFLHQLITFFVITQFIDIFVVRSDLIQLIENVKITFMSSLVILKLDALIFTQNQWKQVLGYVTEADEYEREHQDEIRGEIIDRYTKYSRRVTYCFWVLGILVAITIPCTPLLKFLSSQNYRQGLKNGTEPFPQVFSAWMPIDKYHSPGSWITVIWHTCICTYGTTCMVAYDTTVIVIMRFYGGKFDLLRERAKLMLGAPGDEIIEDEAGTIIRQLHYEHVLLKKQLALFNSLLSPIMCLVVVMTSLHLCASSFQITLATSAAQRLFLAIYLVYGLAQSFMYCWQSENVLAKSDLLMFGVYESQWWAASVKLRRNILILAGQFQSKYVFTAGPFFPLTASTFISIVKVSYSYYTLLRK